jgi:hypothetical protein
MIKELLIFLNQEKEGHRRGVSYITNNWADVGWFMAFIGLLAAFATSNPIFWIPILLGMGMVLVGGFKK